MESRGELVVVLFTPISVLFIPYKERTPVITGSASTVNRLIEGNWPRVIGMCDK